MSERTPTMQDIERLERQLHELRKAVLSMAGSLGAALPHTPQVVEALNALVDTEPPS